MLSAKIGERRKQVTARYIQVIRHDDGRSSGFTLALGDKTMLY